MTDQRVEFETSATVLMATAEPGIIKIGDQGLEFQYRNHRLGSPFLLPWDEFKQVELSISTSKKIAKRFLVVTNTKAMKFESDEAVKLLKLIGNKVGTEIFVRQKSLFDPIKNIFLRK